MNLRLFALAANLISMAGIKRPVGPLSMASLKRPAGPRRLSRRHLLVSKPSPSRDAWYRERAAAKRLRRALGQNPSRYALTNPQLIMPGEHAAV